ncbi:host cell division inhibitor Icd-like protein [Pantoea brenneri]|uniref:host cell division inhibitor Icd-like protein n=1 Tax=Pantoea brenneri TaxID=472694 RepID=UPI002446A519|nr:host cell division inhibitor Icd-like protein [Pantoea brenneri]MDH2123782.1 host cell division inhibitor Icd-like protein [Pantoea brenneri]
MNAASWCRSQLRAKPHFGLAKLSQPRTNLNGYSARDSAENLSKPDMPSRKTWSYVSYACYHNPLKNSLLRSQYSDYAQPSPAKSGVRIGVLVKYKATHDAPSVFFCVLASAHPFFSDMVIIRVAHKAMVGWMGAEKSAPVTLYAGYANPVQLTTSEIGVSGGGIKSQYKEAAIMATTLTQATPNFKFRFLALSRADMQAKPCRVSVQATSEKEARRVLAPHFILSLAARLPVQEAAHV